jgi:hypothetical protein
LPGFFQPRRLLAQLNACLAFLMAMRLYALEAPILDVRWAPPAIKRVQ